MNPASGRFISTDTYGGSSADPASLHKYSYANGNPVSLTDPSGHFSIVEFSASSSMIGTLAGISTLGLGAYVRGEYNRDGVEHVPDQSELANAITNSTAVEITDSSLTADEFFDQYVSTFRGINDGGVATVTGAPVYGAGQKLTFTIVNGILQLGQPPFDVKIKRYDPTERVISAVTLGGHPLRGWRYWKVNQIGNDPHHFTVETGAVDVPNRTIDIIKALGPAVLPIWQEYMQGAVRFSGGKGQEVFPGSIQGQMHSPYGQDYILGQVHP